VLIVNAGSSSLKLRVLDPADTVVAKADLPPPRGTVDLTAMRSAISDFGPVDAVGHRIVHGGAVYTRPVLLDGPDGKVRQRLESLTDLAPLHQPKSLAALDAVGKVLPDTPAVASFDTAFHATIPRPASTFALPAEWRARWNLRRYGFHGLSHSYVSRRAAELLTAVSQGPPEPGRPEPGRPEPGRPEPGRPEPWRPGAAPAVPRIVSCHLGAGASLCAVSDGTSVDTTMGFTPLDGLVMATRSGSVDPGLVLWLEEHAHMPPAELAETLENRSGLAGLTGTDDMREVLSRAAAGDERAALGRDVYVHRLRALIAAMTAALDGLDALVFTGGVGENSPEIRARAAAGLGFLGVRVDDARNRNLDGADDYEISGADAAVRLFVIAAREDKQIAAEVRSVLSARDAGG
jgi:acetate kinase